MGIKIWWTRVEVWLKNTRVSVANEFVFCQNLNESPSNLNLHELPWSNTFLPREIQYFPNHNTTHRLLLCMRARIDRVSITCVTPCARDPRSVKDVAWMYSPRFTVYVIVNSSKQPPSSIPQAQPRRIEICEQRLFWEWDQDLLHCHFHW